MPGRTMSTRALWPRSAALFVAPDGFFAGRAAQFANLTALNRIPAIYAARELVATGGLMSYGTDLADMFHQVDMVGGLSRIALLVNAEDPEGARRYLEQSQTAATPLGLTIEPVEVREIGGIPRAFSKFDELKVDGLVGTADSLFTVERKNIIQLAMERRLPAMMHSRETAQAGALMSYAPSYVLIMRRAAIYVDKIIRGVDPADLPVEQPTKFELVINLKTAEAIGLTVPPMLLGRADEVIE
jgi:putative ABC transport system substrate-binding protein